MEKHKEACKNLIWLLSTRRKHKWQDPYKGYVVCFGKECVHAKYIKLIKDMYDRTVTSVRTSGGITSEFPITRGLHQGSAFFFI